MENIILKSYLHITSRKNDKGKLVNNALTKDLKIQEGDFLTVEITLTGSSKAGDYVEVTNNENELTKK